MTKSVSEFTVIYRGQSLQISQRANTTIGDLGHQLQSITGVAPHTMKLLLAHGRLLMPFTDSHASFTLTECGINDGVSVRMLGVLPQEISAVSRTLEKSAGDRIIGFDEEEKRAMQRLPGIGSTIIELPSGPYIFHEFRTLRLEGVELNPSPARALHLMHQLASDRGIVAIMNKYRWSVGMMTEMPPVGHVGISPKCLLGVNKNHGEEISLRLRTDDLKGFRKYDVIKKTLLHELAHMVYSEHDEHFYRLDKQLNKEVTLLDWTKSKGHSLNGITSESYEALDKSAHMDTAPAGYHLGGVVNVANPREAAASAAMKRLETQPVLQDINSTIQSPKGIESDQHMRPIVHPDNEMLVPEICSIDIDKSSVKPDSETMNNVEKNTYQPDPDDQVEPDPDDAPQSAKLFVSESWEPDPDMTSEEFSVIMDPTSQVTARLQQAMAKLKCQVTSSEIQPVLQTLSTILRNIMDHPHDVKYRRLRKTNTIFQHRVAKFEGAIEVLKTIGFVDDDSEYQHEYLILKRDDPGLLWLARSFLETCAP